MNVAAFRGLPARGVEGRAGTGGAQLGNGRVARFSGPAARGFPPGLTGHGPWPSAPAAHATREA